MNTNGRVARFIQDLTVSAPFRKIGPKVIPPVDRALSRLSGGRIMLASALLPSLVLTTTGAKSGQPRKVPLATVADDDGSFYVVGSNFAREHHPAWTANLIANRDATVTFRGRTVPVTARLLDADERADVWPHLVERWPGWGRYEAVTSRAIRVFHLVPAGDGHRSGG